MTSSRRYPNPMQVIGEWLMTRGTRLIIYLVITAILFPSARFILLVAGIVSLAVVWFRDYERSRKPYIFYLAGFVLFLLIGYTTTVVDVRRVDFLRSALSMWGDGISRVQDGIYTGTGQGLRGPVTVQVEVKNRRIVGLKTLEYPDLISVQDNELATFKRAILQSGKLERPAQPQMFRGATETLTGYVNAIESALARGVPEYPTYSLFSSVFLDAFLGTAPDRVTLNALAILFAAFMVFEYTLQSMLVPGTGRSINCYNCASCVGACPVKEVEGVQMPMGLVLLTRVGDYDRVLELSKYCVGCGRCAQKCPIGNSGPLVISAAYQASRKQRQMNEAARERGRTS